MGILKFLGTFVSSRLYELHDKHEKKPVIQADKELRGSTEFVKATKSKLRDVCASTSKQEEGDFRGSSLSIQDIRSIFDSRSDIQEHTPFNVGLSETDRLIINERSRSRDDDQASHLSADVSFKRNDDARKPSNYFESKHVNRRLFEKEGAIPKSFTDRKFQEDTGEEIAQHFRNVHSGSIAEKNIEEDRKAEREASLLGFVDDGLPDMGVFIDNDDTPESNVEQAHKGTESANALQYQDQSLDANPSGDLIQLTETGDVNEEEGGASASNETLASETAGCEDRSRTSDYFSSASTDSVASTDSEPREREVQDEDRTSEFARNCTERISKRYNSEPGLYSKSNLQSVEPLDFPETPQQHQQIFYFNETVHNAVIGNGEGNSILTRSLGTTESSVLLQRVQHQTESAIKEIQRDHGGVKTKGFHEALRVLENHKFLILAGDGRTYLAKQLLHHLTIGNEVEPYVLGDHKEHGLTDSKRSAVLLMYDITSTTKFDDKRFDRFLMLINRVLLPSISNEGNQMVIVTLKDEEETAVQNFIRENAERFIDLSTQRVRSSPEERSDIFDCYIGKQGIELCLNKGDETFQKTGVTKSSKRKLARETKEEILALIDNQHFINQLTLFFKSHAGEGVDFFVKPRRGLVEKLEECRRNDPRAFFIMLAARENNGEVTLQQIDSLQTAKVRTDEKLKSKLLRGYSPSAKNQRKSLMYLFAKKNGLLKTKSLAMSLKNTLKEVDRSLLEKYDDTYRFSSKSVENSLLIVCFREFPVEVIQSCPWEFLMQFVGSSTQFSKDDHNLRITFDDEDTQSLKAVVARLIEGIMDLNVRQTWGHRLFTEKWFLQKFIEHLESRKHFTKEVMLKQDRDTEDPYYCLYFTLETKFTVQHGDDTPNTVADYLLDLSIWKQKLKKSSYKENVALQFVNLLNKAVELGLETTVKRLMAIGTSVSSDTFGLALKSRRLTIIELLIAKEDLKNKHLLQWYILALKESTSNDIGDVNGQNLFASVAEKFDHHLGVKVVQELFAHFVQEEHVDSLVTLIEFSKRCHFSPNIDKRIQGETTLTFAARKNSGILVETLLNLGADQTCRNVQGDMPVHIAAVHGFCRILEILYKKEASMVHEMDEKGDTPLHIAVSCDNVQVIKLHIDKLRLEQNVTNRNGETPVHAAVKYKRYGILELLVYGGDCTIQDKSGNTALQQACAIKDYCSIELLLNASTIRKDRCLLVDAIKSNDERLAKLLLDYGFSGKEDTSLLIKSVDLRLHGMTKVLLEQGWNANGLWKGRYPIHAACYNGDVKMIQLLAEHGARLDTRTIDGGLTIAHIAVEKERPDTLKEILSVKGSPSLRDIQDSHGQTALHVACKKGMVEYVRLLLESGFSTTRANASGKLPYRLVQDECQHRKTGRSKKRYSAILKMLAREAT